MSDCIFCAIAKGEIPCAKVFEDDKVIVFLDLNPVRPGHALVVPKAHFETIFDVTSEYAQPVLNAMQNVGRALMKALGATGVNVLQNNYPDAGQAVPHVHWHLIPRAAGDGLTFWEHGSYPSQQAMADLAVTISKQL